MQTSSGAGQHNTLQRSPRLCGPDGFTHNNQLRCLPFTERLIWQLLEDKVTRLTYGTKYWFHERSDPLYSSPTSKEHVLEINRVKFNYGRSSRLPVFFWCTIFLKKYRHITLAKDYTLITFPKGRYAANMQRFHVLCLARGN